MTMKFVERWKYGGGLTLSILLTIFEVLGAGAEEGAWRALHARNYGG